MQVDALMQAGVEADNIFVDELSGAKEAKERPRMAEPMKFERRDDDIYFWRLDRVGRSVIDLLNTRSATTTLAGASGPHRGRQTASGNRDPFVGVLGLRAGGRAVDGPHRCLSVVEGVPDAGADGALFAKEATARGQVIPEIDIVDQRPGIRPGRGVGARKVCCEPPGELVPVRRACGSCNGGEGFHCISGFDPDGLAAHLLDARTRARGQRQDENSDGRSDACPMRIHALVRPSSGEPNTSLRRPVR
jgi:hypothetical protein